MDNPGGIISPLKRVELFHTKKKTGDGGPTPRKIHMEP